MKRAKRAARRLLVVFGTPFLYGMERSVIETFDLLRPEVEPVFLVSRINTRRRTRSARELVRRRLTRAFMSDRRSWPVIGRPRSLRDLFAMIESVATVNWDALRLAWKSDVLYLGSLAGAIQSCLAALVIRARGGRVIFRFHEIPATATLRWRFAMWLATDLVHYTQMGRSMAEEVLPSIRNMHAVVISPPIERCDAALRAESPKRIFFVGQVTLSKGIDFALDAFDRLAESHPEAELHLLGSVVRSTAKGLVDAAVARWPGRVIVHGFVSDPTTAILDAYVLVMPTPASRYLESFGRVIAEAAVAGVPSVTFGSGASVGLIEDGKSGIICCDESAEELAQGIARYLDDPDLRNRHGEEARRVVGGHCDPLVVRRAWLELLGHRC